MQMTGKLQSFSSLDSSFARPTLFTKITTCALTQTRALMHGCAVPACTLLWTDLMSAGLAWSCPAQMRTA